jgi:cobalt-zinc-cadmium efflux system protein
MSRHPHIPVIPRSLRPLALALLITASVMVLEIIVGLLSHSLALLADAGHMATDAAALGMSLAASLIARQPATRTKTYGFYRTEILAAFLNGLTLWLVVVWIVYEAIRRFLHPPVVQAPMMLVTATIGLAANLGSSWVLRRSQTQSLNARSAYLHVLADAVGSISVIGAAVVMWLTSWYLADPIASLLVCAVIIWGSWSLISQSVNILLEGSPAHIDVVKVMRAIQEVPGIRRVHDVHIWTITSGMEAMSGHIIVEDLRESRRLLDRLNALVRERFGIQHSTFQLEDH